MKQSALLVCVLIAVGAGAAHAQPTKLGIGGRYAYVRNIDSENDVNMGGVLARIRGATFGAEGAVDYRNEDLGGGFDLKVWPVTASLLIHPLPTVYGLVGLGWYNATLDPPGDVFEDRTDTQLGYHLGAGLELPVSPNFHFVGDLRYLFVDHDFRDLPEEIGKVEANYFSVNLGGVVYLR